MARFDEDVVEYAALEYLAELGYQWYTETDWQSAEKPRERQDYDEVILTGRLEEALRRINPNVPASSIADAVRKVKRAESIHPHKNNQAFHRLLVDGVDVEYQVAGQRRYGKVWLVDFENPTNNDWLAVNQFTIIGTDLRSRAKTHRRPDVILFVNGLPLVLLELKNAADANATIHKAFNQLQTYQNDIPDLFTYNEGLVISDGVAAKVGTLTGGIEWFKPWRTIAGDTLDDVGFPQLEVLIKGLFEPRRFLDFIRYFTVFEVDGDKIIKRTAGYHQYHAVNKAVESTIHASRPGGNQRAGVIWHTQGSGKSLSMLFYAGKIIQHPAMENPTVIVLTDRNDLDDQLYGTFAGGKELLRQAPAQAESRDHLQTLLHVAAGGVVFTTIQKFRPEGRQNQYPQLSERHNIIFIADEAHRSQYGFHARLVQDEEEAYLAYGFAKYVRDALPNASFIGFTGTPIETTDANTKEVFGDYIDIYDIQRAVDDGATVPIYYESRLAPLRLLEEKREFLDVEFEEITETAEDVVKDTLRSKWSSLEAMVGAEKRLQRIAQDIVTHFEQRSEALAGKGMIVCMSRRICVELYAEIVRLRPAWDTNDDQTGAIKVVMTGSASDPAEYQPHVRNKPRRKALSERFKDPDDPLKLVIVRDMWLTGFDAPPLHTMYIDKPMQGHGLMQAIARVNRVFRDKPGGLIVDYLGIAIELKEAVHRYTQEGYAEPAQIQERAVELMKTDYDRVQVLFHGFNYRPFFDGTPSQRLRIIPNAMEHVLGLTDGKKRFMDGVTRLSKSYALSTPHPETVKIREEVAFFQAIRAAFVKTTPAEGMTREEMDVAVKQLVSEAVVAQDVISIFDAAGIKTPDVSILSDDFLAEMQVNEHKNLALEFLRKLLNDEIKARSGKNAVQARGFGEMLENAIKRYQNRIIDVAGVIDELIGLAKDMRDANQRGEDMGLSEEELAFYDALAANGSARDVLGDKQLAIIATELVKAVKSNATIDWTVKQSARAKIRVLVKRILRQFGYPPDLQEEATKTVLEQAELLAAGWV